jgi:hypothetical protein
VKKLMWAVDCEEVQNPLIFLRWQVGNFFEVAHLHSR